MADPFWDDFYNAAGATDYYANGGQRPTKQRVVQTVAVDPFTGQPIVAGGSGNMPATQRALNEKELRLIRDPGFDATKETITAAPPPFSTGYQAGYQAKPSYRLLPDPAALNAIETAAPAANSVAWRKAPAFASLSGPAPNYGAYKSSHYLAPMRQQPFSIGFDPSSPEIGQEMANNLNMPIRTKSGAVIQPGMPAVMPQTAQAMAGASGTTPAGYVYDNGVRVGKADWAAGMTPAQQYATAAAPALRPTNAAERAERSTFVNPPSTSLTFSGY